MIENPYQDENPHREGKRSLHNTRILADKRATWDEGYAAGTALVKQLVEALEAIEAPYDNNFHGAHCAQHRRIARRALKAARKARLDE